MSVLAEHLGDGVLRLTLNRPQAANALNRETQETLVAELARAGRDPSVRAVVLTGAGGRVFSAGADLREVLGGSPEEARALRRALLLNTLLAILDCPRPVIAAVRGKAVGGGAMLALLGDEVLMEPQASLSMPEIALGIASPVGISIIRARGGRTAAHALVQANESMDAEDAQRRGLADSVHADAEMDAAAMARAIRLGGFESVAFAANKAWMNAPLREAIVRAAEAAARVKTGDAVNAR